MRKLIIVCLLVAIASSQFLSDNYSNFEVANKQIQEDNNDYSDQVDDNSENNSNNEYEISSDFDNFKPVGRNLLKCLGAVRNIIKTVALTIVKVRLGNINIISNIIEIAGHIKSIKNECISTTVNPEINDTLNALQTAGQSSSKLSLLNKLAGLLAIVEVKLF